MVNIYRRGRSEEQQLTAERRDKSSILTMLRGALSNALYHAPSWWHVLFPKGEDDNEPQTDETTDRNPNPDSRKALLESLRRADLQRSHSFQRRRYGKMPLSERSFNFERFTEVTPAKLRKTTVEDDSNARVHCSIDTISSKSVRSNRTLPSNYHFKSHTAKRVYECTTEKTNVCSDTLESKRRKASGDKYTFRKPPSLFDPIESTTTTGSERSSSSRNRSDVGILAALASLPSRNEESSGKYGLIDSGVDAEVLRTIVREEIERLHGKMTCATGPRWTCVGCFSLNDATLSKCPNCQCIRNPDITVRKSTAAAASSSSIQSAPVTNEAVTTKYAQNVPKFSFTEPPQTVKTSGEQGSSVPKFSFSTATTEPPKTLSEAKTTEQTTNVPKFSFSTATTEPPKTVSEAKTTEQITNVPKFSFSTATTEPPKTVSEAKTTEQTTNVPKFSFSTATTEPPKTLSEPKTTEQTTNVPKFSFSTATTEPPKTLSEAKTSEQTTNVPKFSFSTATTEPPKTLSEAKTTEQQTTNIPKFSFSTATTESPKTVCQTSEQSTTAPPKFSFTSVQSNVPSPVSSAAQFKFGSFPSKFSFGAAAVTTSSLFAASSTQQPFDKSTSTAATVNATSITSVAPTIKFGTVGNSGEQTTASSNSSLIKFGNTAAQFDTSKLFGSTSQSTSAFNFSKPASLFKFTGTSQASSGLFSTTSAAPMFGGSTSLFGNTAAAVVDSTQPNLFTFKASVPGPTFQFGSTSAESKPLFAFGSKIGQESFAFGQSTAEQSISSTADKPSLFVFSGGRSTSEDQSKSALASQEDDAANPFSVVNSEIASRKTKHPRKSLHRR